MRVRDSRVVVTGGAGFIGSHLVDVLLARGNRVIIIDDFSSGSRDNLASHLSDPRLRLEVADILDAQRVEQLVAGADFVFHLAVRNVRLSLRKPTLVHEVNATGTLNVLKAAAAARVKRFLYCSSSEVNGTASVVPLPEDYRFRPETVYGAAKLVGEYYTQVFHRSGWLPTVVARPHNNYGPREHYAGVNGELIPRYILLALARRPLVMFGDGAQTRDFTYVTETAAILPDLLECEEALGGTFNVCRGEEVSVLEIARLVAELTGCESGIERLPARPSDVLRLCGDPSRLKATLGRSPAIAIREGLASTIAWFREHVPLTPQVLDALRPENWREPAVEPWLARASGPAS